jgi:hypothetical protein
VNIADVIVMILMKNATNTNTSAVLQDQLDPKGLKDLRVFVVM